MKRILVSIFCATILWGNAEMPMVVEELPLTNNIILCEQIKEKEEDLTCFLLSYKKLKTRKKVEYIYKSILKSLYSDLRETRRTRILLCSGNILN